MSIFGEDLQIRPSLARRINRLVREVDGPVDVREGARLLGPLCRRQDDVGKRGRLGRENVLRDHKQVLAREILPHACELRHRYGRTAGRSEC